MKVPFAFPGLPVSVACLASCELHQAASLPEICTDLSSSSRTLSILVLCPVTGKERGGEAMAEMHFQGLFHHLYGTNVNSGHFICPLEIWPLIILHAQMFYRTGNVSDFLI